MKVLITGGTGLVGKKIILKLLGAKHKVVVLTRDAQRAQEKLSLPVKFVDWDAQSALAEETIHEVEAVINLMGENIAGGRWDQKRKKAIYDSRVKGTEALSKSFSQLKVYVGASAIGIYRKNRAEGLTESADLDQDFLAQVCRDWEKSSLEFPAARKVIFRIGVVLDQHEGALAKMLLPFKLGLGGSIGQGKQWFSWIHGDDLANLFVEALENSAMEGVYNAVAPNPCTNQTLTAELGRILRRPTVLPVPPFALKLIFGEMASLMIDGQKVIPERLNERKYHFKYSSIDCALEQLLNYEKLALPQ